MEILTWARKVQAIAQNGLAFTKDPFDRERYEQLQELVNTVLSSELGISKSDSEKLWVHEAGYATPKVDVRGAAFRDGKILLVKEVADGGWTLPGGWADINDAPSKAVTREFLEESGYEVRVTKLAAVYDRNLHGHPPIPFHAYKLLFLCEITGGAPAASSETSAVDFFAADQIPPLSLSRITQKQIARLFEHKRTPQLPTEFD